MILSSNSMTDSWRFISGCQANSLQKCTGCQKGWIGASLKVLVRLVREVLVFSTTWQFFVDVSLRILETWIVPVVDAVTNGGGSGISSGASVLRVARVMRVLRTARMARLVRLMPELMILIKGTREWWKTRELMMTFKVIWIWWLKCTYMYTLYTQYYRVSSMFVFSFRSLLTAGGYGHLTSIFLWWVANCQPDGLLEV